MHKESAETLTKIFAVLLWIGAFFTALGALAVLFVGSFIGGALGGIYGPMFPMMDDMMMGDALATGGFVGLGIIIALIVLAAITAAFVTIGRGVWRREHWSRVAALVVSIIFLFSFPIGTLVGIFGIWLFGFDAQVKALFSGAAAKATPAPKKRSRKKKR